MLGMPVIRLLGKRGFRSAELNAFQPSSAFVGVKISGAVLYKSVDRTCRYAALLFAKHVAPHSPARRDFVMRGGDDARHAGPVCLYLFL